MMEFGGIVRAVTRAARHVIQERPYVGGYDFEDAPTTPYDYDAPKAHERALAGRLGIWLARQQGVWALEAEGVRVDMEYDQMGQGDPKMVNGKKRRIDLLLHRRGDHNANLLVCEVKAGAGLPPAVDSTDQEKLQHMTMEPFEYKAGVWLQFPRGPEGKLYIATYSRGSLRDDISEVHFNGRSVVPEAALIHVARGAS